MSSHVTSLPHSTTGVGQGTTDWCGSLSFKPNLLVDFSLSLNYKNRLRCNSALLKVAEVVMLKFK